MLGATLASGRLPGVVESRQGGLHEALVALGPLISDHDAWWHHRDDLAERLPGPELRALHLAVRAELYEGHGAVLVRTGADMPDDAVRLLQLLLGGALGDILTIAPDEPGRPLFKVSAVEGQGMTGDYRGNAKKREAIGFHTDGSGVHPPIALLGMACIRPARYGGESRLADAHAVHRIVSLEALRVLESPLPRENPYHATRPEQMVVAPVFDRDRNNAFSYHPARVRNGILAVRGELSAVEANALAELDERLEGAAIDFPLEAGDILLLDNQRIAHDRRAFTDDPRSPRLLERLWIGSARSAKG